MASLALPTYAFGAFPPGSGDKVLYRDGIPVALTPKAFDTLAALVEAHPRLVSKDDCWLVCGPARSSKTTTSPRTCRCCAEPWPTARASTPVIETVPRRGYRFAFRPHRRVERVDLEPAAGPGFAVPASPAPAVAPVVSGAAGPPIAPALAAPTGRRGGCRRPGAALAAAVLAVAIREPAPQPHDDRSGGEAMIVRDCRRASRLSQRPRGVRTG